MQTRLVFPDFASSCMVLSEVESIFGVFCLLNHKGGQGCGLENPGKVCSERTVCERC